MLWLATRTVGIPLGPAAGCTEDVGVLDLMATGAETVVVVLCLLGLRARALISVIGWSRWSISARTALLTTALVIGTAVVTAPVS
jgi:hypothetical protein